MIYREFDQVERPPEKVINNDRKLDKWMVNYGAKQRKKLIEYHKNDRTVDRDPLNRPTMSYGKK